MPPRVAELKDKPTLVLSGLLPTSLPSRFRRPSAGTNFRTIHCEGERRRFDGDAAHMGMQVFLARCPEGDGARAGWGGERSTVYDPIRRAMVLSFNDRDRLAVVVSNAVVLSSELGGWGGGGGGDRGGVMAKARPSPFIPVWAVRRLGNIARWRAPTSTAEETMLAMTLVGFHRCCMRC